MVSKNTSLHSIIILPIAFALFVSTVLRTEAVFGTAPPEQLYKLFTTKPEPPQGMTFDSWAKELESADPQTAQEIWETYYACVKSDRFETVCRMIPRLYEIIEPHRSLHNMAAHIAEPLYRSSKPEAVSPEKLEALLCFSGVFCPISSSGVSSYMLEKSGRLSYGEIIDWTRARFEEALEYDRSQGDETITEFKPDQNHDMHAKLSVSVLDWQRRFINALQRADNMDPVNDENGRRRSLLREEWYRMADKVEKNPEDVKNYYLFLRLLRETLIQPDENDRFPDLDWFAETAASKTSLDAKFIAETLTIIARRFEDSANSLSMATKESRKHRQVARSVHFLAESFWRRALAETPTASQFGLSDSMPLRIPKSIPMSSMHSIEYETITPEEARKRFEESYDATRRQYHGNLLSQLLNCLHRQGRFEDDREDHRTISLRLIKQADDCADRNDAQGEEDALRLFFDRPDVWKSTDRYHFQAHRDLMQLLMNQERRDEMRELLEEAFEATRDLPRVNNGMLVASRPFFMKTKHADELLAKITEAIRLRLADLKRPDQTPEACGVFEELVREMLLVNELSPARKQPLLDPSEEIHWEILPYIVDDWQLARLVHVLLYPKIEMQFDREHSHYPLDRQSHERTLSLIGKEESDGRLLQIIAKQFGSSGENELSSPFSAEIRRRKEIVEKNADAPLPLRLDAALEAKDWQSVVRIVDEIPDPGTISFEVIAPRIYRASVEAEKHRQGENVSGIRNRLSRFIPQ